MPRGFQAECLPRYTGRKPATVAGTIDNGMIALDTGCGES
jgi:hypothetical protein